MLLWNFRDKTKLKDVKSKEKAQEDSRRQGSNANASPPSPSRSKRSSTNISPRSSPSAAKPTGRVGTDSLRLAGMKDGELVYATDDSGTSYIKQARLDSIIDEIIAEHQLISDKLMTLALLINVRAYLTAEEFWEKLKIRFELKPYGNVSESDFVVAKQIVQSRWFGLLRKWLQTTPYDIDDGTLQQIRHFVSARSADHPTSANLILQHVSLVCEERKKEALRLQYIHVPVVASAAPASNNSGMSSSSSPSVSHSSGTTSASLSGSPGAGASSSGSSSSRITRSANSNAPSTNTSSSSLGSSTTSLSLHESNRELPRPLITALESLQSIEQQSIHQLPPMELARQLCLAEFETFSRLRPSEFIGTAWMKSNKEELAPTIVALTSRFNALSNWASVSILNPHCPDRLRVMEFIIALEDDLIRLQNIASALAIHSALDSRQIIRLKHLWEKLSPAARKYHNDHSQLLNPLRNWRSLRDYLAQCRVQRPDLPVMPYLGMFLTDIVMCEETERDPSHANNSQSTSNSGKNPLINFARCRAIASIIQEIQQYQSVPYRFVTLPVIQDYFRKIEVLPEPELDAFSAALLPFRSQYELELDNLADGPLALSLTGSGAALATYVASPLITVLQKHLVSWSQAYLSSRFSTVSARTFGTIADSFLYGDMSLVETELSSYALLLRLQTSAADIHLLSTVLAGSSNKANKALLIVLLAHPADMTLAALSSVEVVVADDMPTNAPCLFRTMQVPVFREARARSAQHNNERVTSPRESLSHSSPPRSLSDSNRARTASGNRTNANRLFPTSSLSSSPTNQQLADSLMQPSPPSTLATANPPTSNQSQTAATAPKKASIQPSASSPIAIHTSRNKREKSSESPTRQLQNSNSSELTNSNSTINTSSLRMGSSHSVTMSTYEDLSVLRTWTEFLREAGLEDRAHEIIPLLEREGLTSAQLILQIPDEDLKELGLKVGHVVKMGRKRDELLQKMGRPPLSQSE